MSSESPRQAIEWENIDTVLLDMDGTLLDLHFDNYFWRHHVPQRFAEKHNMSIAAARKELYRRYSSVRGTMEWYSVDYWTDELDLDIAMLKKEVDHLIAVHPHVVPFLEAARRTGKRTVLVTNAHGKSLDLKMNRTKLGEYLDALVCAHDLGVPKEEVRFWEKLKRVDTFTPERTLLIDDNPDVLTSARSYGIRYLLKISKPDTQEPASNHPDFETLTSFAELTRALLLQWTLDIG